MDRKEYWASLPREEIASAINSKFEAYLKWLSTTGLADRIQESYDTYYGFNKLGGFGVDKQDEAISRITVPHFKNLLSRIHMMTCQAKLSFQAKAINSDSKSLLEADLAKGLLEYEISDKSMGQCTSQMVEQALVMFGSYIYAPWDRNKGDPVRPDGSGARIIMTGDQVFYNLSAYEVARSTAAGDSPWYIVETKVNKYDLAVQYPKFGDQILSAAWARNIYQLTTPYSNNTDVIQDEDVVVVRTLLHEKTPACPKGRVVLICNNEVLEDDDFEYKKMPVVEMKASTVLSEAVADSPASSLVGLQEILDRVYSANITNVLNGCISNVYTNDENLKISEIRKGQTLITAASPPVSLALTGVSPDATNLVNDIINQETLLSGLNNTAKGDPQSSLKSGTSLALILSTAVQYISGVQQNYAKAVADLATIVINNLQTFCKVERIAFIAGAANKAKARSFSAKDLMNIDRITCELGNPVTQNVAGRMQMVELLLQYQAIKDPRKIDDFLRTGNWESLTEDNFNESILIKEENEMLRRGEMPIVLLTDKHPMHIMEALSVLYSQDARNNPTIVKAVLDHVQEHIDKMKEVPPDLAAILGLQPLPSQLPPQGQGPGQNQGQPEMMGANMPSVPAGTPDQFAGAYAGYAQQTAGSPAAQIPV